MPRHDCIDQREEPVRLDARQHPRHDISLHRRSAGRPPARVAPEQAGRHMDMIDLQRPEHVGRYASANPAGGDEG